MRISTWTAWPWAPALIISSLTAILLLMAPPAATHEERPPLDAPSDLGARALARVNGAVITGEDFKVAFDDLPTESRLPARTTPTLLLQTLVRRELLYQAALRAGLDRDPTVARKIQKLARDLLIVEMADRERTKGEAITDEALRQYYDAHPHHFNRPERISASHILVKTRPEAEALLAELKTGADFATLAQEHSRDDLTRDRGGRIFVILRGQMTPEFEAAAFALEPGGISDVVQDKDGYHVVQLNERVPATVVPFETVKEKLRQRLAFERGQDRLRAVLAELEAQGKIEVDEGALAGIK